MQAKDVKSFITSLIDLQEDYSKYLETPDVDANIVQETKLEHQKRMELFCSTIISTVERVYLNNAKHLDTYQRRGLHQQLEIAIKAFYLLTNDSIYRTKGLGDYAARSGFFNIQKSIVNITETWSNSGTERKQKLEKAATNLEDVINKMIGLYKKPEVVSYNGPDVYTISHPKQ